MPSYVVESYAAGSDVEGQRARARHAAELETGVRYLRTTFLPGDETLLHLFEAPSIEALNRAGQLAHLEFDRIVEAVESATSTEPKEEGLSRHTARGLVEREEEERR
jgi:hypothetical protein